MPRSRGSEMPQQQQQQQRQSPRAALLKTMSSDSNGVHAHCRGSPKPEDSHRRSPRSPLVESPGKNQRKSLSRASDLETKLGHAQEELRKVRERLASAEAAKKDVQQELEAAKKLVLVTVAATGEHKVEEEHRGSIASQKREDDPPAEASPVEEGKILADPVEINAPELVPVCADHISKNVDNDVDVERRREDIDLAMEVEEGREKSASGKEKTEMSDLEAKLAEKEEELERCWAENSTLRKQLAEAEAEAGAARAREEEAASKLSQAVEELVQSKARADQLREQVGVAEGTKASLEAEMKMLRIQTGQWRKAADAAAAVLSAPEVAVGRRVAERCPSMDKHLFDGPGSPLVEEGLGGGRRKGAGIRMLGDLWKKKAQYK
ncbi:hypothetical protein Taro_021753 [Colocasia esculenta]|uniref:Interactor of constitutive active ROPs 1 n=1 Tax=Colocasia esculenta TaxID=4460 RepID=A0A843USE5_COLES|nr:hypothetical protein [Colocasia esculenta]